MCLPLASGLSFFFFLKKSGPSWAPGKGYLCGLLSCDRGRDARLEARRDGRPVPLSRWGGSVLVGGKSCHVNSCEW